MWSRIEPQLATAQGTADGKYVAATLWRRLHQAVQQGPRARDIVETRLHVRYATSGVPYRPTHATPKPSRTIPSFPPQSPYSSGNMHTSLHALGMAPHALFLHAVAWHVPRSAKKPSIPRAQGRGDSPPAAQFPKLTPPKFGFSRICLGSPVLPTWAGAQVHPNVPYEIGS